MDYNELKLRILAVFAKREELDGTSVAREVASAGVTIDIHALRMALMRYYKLGLLKRERAGGIFTYSLTQRGLERLHWLEMQKQPVKPGSTRPD
jgi:repressor of nif and glnA expression